MDARIHIIIACHIILIIVLILTRFLRGSDVLDKIFKAGQTTTVNSSSAPFPFRHTTVQNSEESNPLGTNTNDRHSQSVPFSDRAVIIVQIPEESESNDNPPDYSNFLPPSYEEAVERENISIGVEPSNQINNTNWLRKYL